MPDNFTPDPFHSRHVEWTPASQATAEAMLKAVTKIAKARRRAALIAALFRSMIGMFRATAVLGAIGAAVAVIGRTVGSDVPLGLILTALCCAIFGLVGEDVASRWSSPTVKRRP